MQYENLFASHLITNFSLTIRGASNGELFIRNTDECCYTKLPNRPAENSDAFHFEMWMKKIMYEGWNFNSGNYLFTTDTK